jgi:hypothetical protein
MQTWLVARLAAWIQEVAQKQVETLGAQGALQSQQGGALIPARRAAGHGPAGSPGLQTLLPWLAAAGAAAGQLGVSVSAGQMAAVVAVAGGWTASEATGLELLLR